MLSLGYRNAWWTSGEWGLATLRTPVSPRRGPCTAGALAVAALILAQLAADPQPRQGCRMSLPGLATEPLLGRAHRVPSWLDPELGCWHYRPDRSSPRRERLVHELDTTGTLVDLGSDQASCHNPFNGGYYPVQLSRRGPEPHGLLTPHCLQGLVQER